MKKLLKFVLPFMLLGAGASLAACQVKKDTKFPKDPEVKLTSVVGSQHETPAPVDTRIAYLNPIPLADDAEGSVTTSDETSISTAPVSTELGYNVLVVPTDADEYDVTINLENPDDHSIQDFRITTDDTTLKMLNKNTGTYDAIVSDKSIKWGGNDNSTYRFTLKSESEDAVESITISEILYLDRETKTVEKVDLSTGPSYVDVIKADEPMPEIVKYKYDADNYVVAEVKVTYDGIEDVTINGSAVENEGVVDVRLSSEAQTMAFTWKLPYKGDVKLDRAGNVKLPAIRDVFKLTYYANVSGAFSDVFNSSFEGRADILQISVSGVFASTDLVDPFLDGHMGIGSVAGDTAPMMAEYVRINQDALPYYHNWWFFGLKVPETNDLSDKPRDYYLQNGEEWVLLDCAE